MVELKKTESSKHLFLINSGDLKIHVIKLICNHTSHDLRDAKELVEQAPVEITNINYREEETLLEELIKLGKGCQAEIKK